MEKLNILAIKDDQQRIVGFIIKNGLDVQIYTCSVAGMDDIEDLMKTLGTK